MASILDAAAGRWPTLLMELGGLSSDQLTDRHQPCPSCAVQGIALGPGRNVDRYRWDRDDGPGGWFCSQCGGKDRRGGGGSGVDLLMRVKGWDLKQACAAVERHLGIEPTRTTSPARTNKRPHRIPDQPPPDTSPPALGRSVAQWCYRNAAGEQLFWVQRIERDNGRKLFVHRTWLDGTWHYPSRRDGFASEWPAPRPVYRLPDLVERPTAPVLVVEGEKAADAAAGMFPDHVVLAWCGGTAGVRHVDWSALAGRDVTLWPDNDAQGRDCMAWLAAHLLPIAATVAAVTFDPADQPDGWDLGDASWKPARAAAVLKTLARPVVAPPPPPEPPAPPPAAATPAAPLPAAPFTCLGFDGDQFFYLPHSTGQVTRIMRGSHTGTPLVSLAPIAYWETIHPSKNGVNWAAAASSLFEQQARIGVFDPDRIRGRGAWLDDGRVVFHLGDRIIVDGAAHTVLKPPPTRYYYEQARHLDGPSETPLSDHDAIRIKNIAEQFRWEVPASAHFLAGWTVLAPVCGALGWRPHIWVTGGAGTGKTTILRAFMRPLMGGVLQTATGGTTEPGLRGILKSDAIPVVFDEFEQNEARDKAIVQNILALARIASSEGGKIYKGTTTGGAIAYEIRSMFCVSSINVSLINKADIDRFCVLGLRKDPMDKGRWLEFEEEILKVATMQNGRALIARTLNHLPTIAQNARAFAQALGKRFGQRFGDQHGTLLAGAWSLEPGGGGVVDLQTADQWIATMDWEHQQHDAGDADELKCRDTILQQIVRYGGGLDASLGEMVQVVATQQALGRTVWSELVPILGRYGLKVFRDGEKLPDGEPAQGHHLAVANGNAQLDQLLKATPWGNGAHRSALRRITGALTPGKPTHFAGIGAKRSTVIPITAEDLAA